MLIFSCCWVGVWIGTAIFQKLIFTLLEHIIYQTLKYILPFPVWQSNEPHETMPIAAFGQKQRPSRFFMTPPRLPYTPSLQSPITVSYFFHVVLITEVYLIHVEAVT